MTEITAQIECWSCENGHNWTIDQDPQFPKVSPFDEGYTAQCLNRWGYPAFFVIDGVGRVDIQSGDCPLCFIDGTFPVPQLALGTDPNNNYAEMSVVDPDKVDEVTKIGGNLVEVGTKFELNQSTGEVEEVPVFKQEEVPLTKPEQDALRQRAQADLDKLAMMEFDPSQI